MEDQNEYIDQIVKNKLEGYKAPVSKSLWHSIYRSVFWKKFLKLTWYKLNIYYVAVVCSTVVGFVAFNNEVVDREKKTVFKFQNRVESVNKLTRVSIDIDSLKPGKQTIDINDEKPKRDYMAPKQKVDIDPGKTINENDVQKDTANNYCVNKLDKHDLIKDKHKKKVKVIRKKVKVVLKDTIYKKDTIIIKK